MQIKYSSKIGIFIEEMLNKLIYGINTIIKFGISMVLVSLSFSKWIKNELNFYHIWINVQRYDKKSFHFKYERLNESLQAVRCHILV